MSVKIDYDEMIVILEDGKFSFKDEDQIPVFDCDDSIVVIENEEYYVNKVYDRYYLPMLEIGRLEFYVAEDSAHAGKATRKYWEDMVDNDPEEFKCIVGSENLIAWALGHSAGPGSVSVRSLNDWLDLVENYPEEQFASYDGSEQEIDAISSALYDELGFCPTVAYRHN